MWNNDKYYLFRILKTSFRVSVLRCSCLKVNAAWEAECHLFSLLNLNSFNFSILKKIIDYSTRHVNYIPIILQPSISECLKNIISDHNSEKNKRFESLDIKSLRQKIYGIIENQRLIENCLGTKYIVFNGQALTFEKLQ